MATTLTPRSLSSETFVSRPLTRDLIEEADLVLTAEAAQRTYILEDHPAAFRKVFSLGQFAESVRAADPALSGRDLLSTVGEHRTTADPDLDVPDPYSRGAETAEACAAAIEELLRVVVPALTGSRKITP
jgi:sulfate adenylyltransferase